MLTNLRNLRFSPWSFPLQFPNFHLDWKTFLIANLSLVLILNLHRIASVHKIWQNNSSLPLHTHSARSSYSIKNWTRSAEREMKLKFCHVFFIRCVKCSCRLPECSQRAYGFVGFFFCTNFMHEWRNKIYVLEFSISNTFSVPCNVIFLSPPAVRCR